VSGTSLARPPTVDLADQSAVLTVVVDIAVVLSCRAARTQASEQFASAGGAAVVSWCIVRCVRDDFLHFIITAPGLMVAAFRTRRVCLRRGKRRPVNNETLHGSRVPTSPRLSNNKGVIGPRSECISVARGVEGVHHR
jgi:hypothetical protein